MTEIQAIKVLEGACFMLKMPGRTKDCLVWQQRGFHYAAIAKQLDPPVKPVTVRWHLHEGWKRIQSHPWKRWEMEQLVEAVNRILAPAISEAEYAGDLLDAAKGRRRHRDTTPTLDENAREVAGHARPLVVDDVIKLLRGKPSWKRLF